jgi:hypothetical protein
LHVGFFTPHVPLRIEPCPVVLSRTDSIKSVPNKSYLLRK